MSKCQPRFPSNLQLSKPLQLWGNHRRSFKQAAYDDRDAPATTPRKFLRARSTAPITLAKLSFNKPKG